MLSYRRPPEDLLVYPLAKGFSFIYMKFKEHKKRSPERLPELLRSSISTV